MVPHERSLVEKLMDKPFVLLGVNSDEREIARQAVKRDRMTWRSWWDGGSTDGPIAKKWNAGWPTIYVIDHRGVIRYKNVRGEELERAVDELLTELERETE